ncbi:MAG: UDP-glucose--hexose-1-phosphate uridylyltransferase [Clostridia bacterium]|nr:UDP-glucose--hexose-1-phosphate uridylyltransferase [Clostridia bacterium]
MGNIGLTARRLVRYGLATGLLPREDESYALNRMLEILKLNEPDESGLLPAALPDPADELEAILAEARDYAAAHGLADDDSVEALDRFDTKLMDCLMPRPAQVIADFRRTYDTDRIAATDAFYKLCGDGDYIRRYRVRKDMKWQTATSYGDLDITINLSKPEKDPRAIAAARKMKPASYPKCMLCRSNEGYAGRANHPARQNLRLIPLTLCGEPWYLQYSPYVYYNEHCIVLSDTHSPMTINRSTFAKLLSFVDFLPHYFIGSNADLPIVGGSILTHEHFQGGRYVFPMERADNACTFTVPGFEDITAGIVKWPMSVIRLTGPDAGRIVELSDRLLNAWRNYSDPALGLFAETDGTPHHTITPIARRRGDLFELDLVLRSNITTEAHPLGVYHPHAEHHHIKKENIGLIEVMGLAVLPARLKKEMADLQSALLNGTDLTADETLAKHKPWADDVLSRHPEFCAATAEAILREEIGKVYCNILEQCGVYAWDEAGCAGFARFLTAAVQARF